MKNTMVMPYGLPDCILYMLRSAKSSQFIGRANANHSFGKRHEAISIRIANKITCNLYFSYYLVLMQKDCPPHEKTCLLDLSNGLNLLHPRKDVAEMVIVFCVSLIVPEDLMFAIKSGEHVYQESSFFVSPLSFLRVS